MSSLLQFSGTVSRDGKVGLEFVQVNGEREDVETYDCGTCGRRHARIHVAFRRPVGMFGLWVMFRYNGERHAPDLSIPISVEKLPRDARPLDDAESSRRWHAS